MSGGRAVGGTRTFIAIELAEELRSELALELRRLRHTFPSVLWVDPGSLHLTLAFLGALSNPQLAAAAEAARAAAAQVEPFFLGLGPLGAFGSPATPRVLWTGITGDLVPLLRLQADLTTQLADRRVELIDSRKDYSPHLTLARLKRPLPEPEREKLLAMVRHPSAPPPASATMRVERIVVMKSELMRPAARYTPLEFCLLGAR